MIERPDLLLALLEGMLDGVSVIDPAGEQIFVNAAMCKMLGFDREELLGKRPPYPYWPAEHLAAIETTFQRFLAGQSVNLELVFQRRDGTQLDVMVAPATLLDDTGAVVAHYTTVKDISDLKRLTRTAMESQERWRSIVENPFDFVVLIDREYRYTFINHTAPGIPVESLIGRATPFDFVDARHHDTMREAFETTFRTGRATTYEVHVPSLDNWYSSIVGPVVQHGEVVGLSILTREITEQKRAAQALMRSEQRLRESHKLETLGTLAAGIAHDLNNMLTPIMAYSELAARDLPAEHTVQEYLTAISAASQRASELVQRVLLFSRRQEPKKVIFDLRELVREHTALIRASLPAMIALVIDTPSEPSYVLADRAQLGQVLTNLATNALQAMGQADGTLTIALAVDDGWLALSVTDTGPGMDAETQRRAFDPFFTTKPVGKGTGLGLSIVDGVVREHGGETEVRSAPGQGARFLVRLPRSQAPDPAPHVVEAAEPAATRQGLRVLMVDDEPMVAKLASQIFARAGYTVTLETSARAALEVFSRDPDAFDVILTDESMPDMTGTALIAEIRHLRPASTCVLMTGRADDELRQRAESLDLGQILAKPFRPEALLDAIDRARKAKGPPT